MNKGIKCKDCINVKQTFKIKESIGGKKHTFKGLRCKLGYKILIGGVPSCPNLFEPKKK